MAKYRGNFRCTILSPKNLIFESEINSIFIDGDRGQYELLAYHYPLVGIMKESEIIVDWRHRIPVKSGVIRFFANECTVLVEESDRTKILTEKE